MYLPAASNFTNAKLAQKCYAEQPKNAVTAKRLSADCIWQVSAENFLQTRIPFLVLRTSPVKLPNDGMSFKRLFSVYTVCFQIWLPPLFAAHLPKQKRRVLQSKNLFLSAKRGIQTG